MDTTVKVNFQGNIKDLVKDSAQVNTNIKSAASTKFAASAASARAASEDSGTARGIGGLTGAASRDFAKQSQGLGGVVRLYATFAANIFAVSAAFRALSEAADTTNLIKGLDQLGAASGRNLGGLSKEFARATDNAISLKEASIAVAKASSSGLGKENILRIADVAKTASQALGVDMTDAVSRLTRGITKLEPELLDELGIFTRVDKASQDYAKSIGKSALSLTDFEKRQAFANAVLDEGQKKFGALKVDSNPFSKLAAAFADITNKGLELVNKVLGPLADLLARSPTALGAAVIGIAAILLKQAVPVLGEVREQLKANAQAATETAKKFQDSFDDKFQAKLAARFKIPDLTKDLLKAETALGKLTREPLAQVPGSLSKSKTISTLLSNPEDTTNLKRAENQAAARQQQLDTNIKGTKQLTDAQRVRATQELEFYNKEIAKAKEITAAINARTIAQQALNNANNAAELRAGQPIGKLDPEVIAARRLSSLEGKANRSQIISNVADNTAVLGIRDSMSILNKELTDKGITGWNKWATVVKGSLVSVATRVMGVVSAFSYIGAIIGIAVAAFQIADAVFTTNAKQAAVYSDNLDSLQSSIKNVTATLDNISSKDPLQQISVESIQARANAMLDLSGSITKAIDSFSKVEQAAGRWDNLWDFIFSKVGKGNLDKLRNNVSQGVESAIESMQEGPAKQAAVEKLRSILNINTGKLDFKAVNNALKGLSDDAATAKIKQLGPELKLIAVQFNNTAAAGTAYAESLKQTAKILDENTASLKAQDFFSKIGDQLLNQAKSLSEAISDPVQMLQALIKVANDVKALSLLPPNTAMQLISSRKELENLAVQYSAVAKRLREVREERQSFEKSFDKSRGTAGLVELQKQINGMKQIEKVLSDILAGTSQKLKQVSGEAAQLISQQFIAGIEYLYKGLNAAKRKAQLEFDKSSLSAQQSLGASNAEEDIRIRKEEIKISLDDLQAKYSNTIAIERLTASINVTNAKEALADAQPGLETTNAENALDIAKRAAEIAAYSTKQILDIQKTAAPGSKDQKALQQLGTILTAALGVEGASASGRSQLKFINTIGAPITRGEQSQKDLSRTNQLKAAGNQLDAESLRLYNEISGVFSEVSAKQAQKLALDALELKANTEIADIERRKQGLRSIISTRPEEFDLIEYELAVAKERLKQDKERAKLKSQFDIDLGVQARGVVIDERRLGLAEQERTTRISLLEQEQRRLDLLAQLGDKTTEITSLEVSAAREKLELEGKLAGIAQAKSAELGAKDVRLNTLNKAPQTEAVKSQIDIINQDKEAIQAKYAAEESALQRIAAARETQNKLLLDYKTALLEINIASESLATIFGKLGTTFGEVAKSILDTTMGSKIYAKEAADNASAQTAAQIKLNEARAGDDELGLATAAAEKVLNKTRADGVKIQDKSINNQLDGYASVLGAVKKNAGEQSRTAQTIGKIEKAIHIAKMAMWAKEQIAAFTNNATTISSALAAAGANSIKAITAAFAAPFPIGFVAGASMIAIMASLLGGKSKAPPVNFSAESQQAVQGTGQQYDANGNLVSRAGGALGDDTAVAKSLNDSIKIIEEHSFDNLEYSNKMLDNLKSIKKNTEGLTAALLQAGFNIKGKAGIQEGTTQGGLGFGQGVVDANNLLFGKGTGITKAMNNLASTIFGGKTKTEIQDTGIAINGTLNALTQGAKGLAEQYTNVKTVVSGGWFKSDKTNYQTFKDVLSDPVNRAISDTFASIRNTVVSAGEALGANNDLVKSITDNFNIAIRVSAQGLKPDELAEAITAELSVAFNSIAEQAFPELQQFRKGGEEMGATIVRLARDMQLTSLALESVGLSLSSIGTMVSKVGITESLIDLTGGIEEFLSKTEFFKDNFLTQEEKLAPVTKRVTDEMKRLGFSSIDTRKEFADLIRTLDLNTKYGQETYAALMNVAQGFAEVYPKLMSAEELRSATLKQQIEIYKLENNTLKALYETRVEELSKLDKSLIAGQLYIYALQDEATAKSELKTAYNSLSSAVKNTISNLKSSIKTLKTYNDSLVAGNLSTLSPSEKYREAKAQAESVAAIAGAVLSNSASAQDIQAKNDAINQLPTVSSAFLEASRVLYASSDTYSKDFSYIQNLIDATTGSLIVQQTDAEKQLEALNLQVSALDIIAVETGTMAEMMTEFNTKMATFISTQDNTAGAALAAAAAGLVTATQDFASITEVFNRLVAPYIPTTSTIQPVPDDRATIAQLVDSVIQLNTQMTKLREEQEAQTKALLVNNTVNTEDITSTIDSESRRRQSEAWRGINSPELN